MPKVGDDLAHARGVVRDMFCGTCAYNLRTRPLIGRCPECGSEYDARPHNLRGIFLPQDLHFPVQSLFLGLGCTGFGGLFLYFAVSLRMTGWYVLAVPLLLCGLVFLRSAAKDLARYVRYHALARQINRQADDDDS